MGRLGHSLLLACFFVVSVFGPILSAASIQVADRTSRLSAAPLNRAGEYVLLKLLGEGDQARVYLALDPKGEMCAVKVFYTKTEMVEVHPERKEYVNKFFKSDGSSKPADDEFEAGIQMHHPRIMNLYHKRKIYSQNGEKVTFIVMEFIPGKNLDQIEKGSLSKKAALTNVLQLLGALRYIFSKGYIHADLWSENLFIDQEGNLKMIDLGSLEPMPEKKSRGKYKDYFEVVMQNIKRIVELGDFTSPEKSRLLDRIEAIASENCDISLQTVSTLTANLQAIEMELDE